MPVGNQVVIATKFGIKQGEQGPSSLSGLESRREQIRRVAEASLSRLGTDRIDLLYQHREAGSRDVRRRKNVQ